QEGTDVTIIATGIMVAEAKVAAETLAQEGISARVLNIHTIKPIDVNAIVKAAQETGCIVTCEEHSIIGGLGSAVAEVLVENNPVPMLRLGVNDTFGESGKPNDLLKKYKLTSNDIVLKVKEVMAKKK
ncbi:MAG: transketolase family protein, partial [Negativicutes bacterium]|nr:transketolase family protein [Negativicutes bacterium]